MSWDEFATARHLVSPDAAEQEQEPMAASYFPSAPSSTSIDGNMFTPLSVAERLRNLSQRNRGPRAGKTLPPMRPGQLYGPLRQDEQAPPANPPEREPDPTVQGVGQTEEPTVSFMPRTDWENEDLRQYQQSFWAHLQSTSGPPPAGEDLVDKHEPSYLRGVDDPLSFVVAETLPLPPMENDYGDLFNRMEPDLYGAVQDETVYAPWQHGEQMADFGLVEHGGHSWEQLSGDEPWAWKDDHNPQAADNTEREDRPDGQPKLNAQTQVRMWSRRILHKLSSALASQPSAELSPRRLVKAVVYGVLVLLLVFFTIQVGQIVLSLLRNEQEFRMVQEEYYAVNGVELEHQASRVELLPSGVTFPPTLTPQLVVTPSPTAIIAVRGGTQAHPEERQAGMAAEVQEPAGTLIPRSKATRYEDNPLTNILDSFVEQRKENPDIVGRVTVEGLIDESIVMRNNTYYLTHDVNGSFSEVGTVFVDEGCSLKSPPENLHLRGQSKVEGKVFAPLRMYSTGGIDFMRRHALVRVDTLYEEAFYVIFAVIETTGVTRVPGDFNYGGNPSFLTDAQMESHVEAARWNSLYDIPVDVLPSDRLLTLSTVSDGVEDRVLVLVARKLRPGETAMSLNLILSSARPKGAE